MQRPWQRFARYVREGWQGRHGLARAFWIDGVLVRLGLFVVIALAVKLTRAATLDEIRLCAVSSCGATLGVALWQTVGIWRSRGGNRRGAGGWVARAVLTYAAWFAVKTTVPALFDRRAWELEGSFLVRVLGRPEEAELSGYFADGVSEALASLLARNPRVSTLHVNSPGGLANEGLRVAALVRDHHLRVVVDDICYSACTLVLLAADERLVRLRASVGFHRGSALVPGTLVWTDGDQRDALRRVGASKDFIEKALRPKGENLFKPTPAELLAEHVVTRRPKASEFVYASSEYDANAVIALLHELGPDRLPHERPEHFARLVREVREWPTQGLTLRDVRQRVGDGQNELDGGARDAPP